MKKKTFGKKVFKKTKTKNFVNHSSVVFSYSTLAVILWGAQPLDGNHCSAAPCCAVFAEPCPLQTDSINFEGFLKQERGLPQRLFHFFHTYFSSVNE